MSILVRHVAFWMLEFCGQKTENESNLRRLVMVWILNGVSCGNNSVLN